MSKKIEKLQEEMQQKWQAIDGIRQKVVGEEREFTSDERDQVEKGIDEIRDVEKKIDAARKDDDLMKQLDDFGKGFQQPSPNGGQRKTSRTGDGSGSIGERFFKSEAYQRWLKSIVGSDGRIPDSAKGLSSPPVEMKDLGVFKKDVLTGSGDTSAGAFVESERTGIYEPLGRYQLTLRDLIAVRTTGSDTVEFVRQLTQVTQAATVPEANVTAYAGSTGEVSGQKPEAAMTFERVSEIVKTIAVWIPATKRALADAGQLRGIIDQELRADLAEETENQILNGDGTGENFTGINNTANVLVQAFDTDIVVTARKAITNLLINGKQMPSAWLFNPQDWESYDLIQDNDGRYYWGGPMAQGPRTLWGVPVAQSFFQTQGTGWLANWMKAIIWDREAATITVSDSHSDFFIRNMVAVLAELRAAFGVIRPSAFVQVDLEAGS